MAISARKAGVASFGSRNKRKVIFVLGMHRSGTSALTGVLQRLGVELGPRLLPAVPDVNPKGFGEHAQIVDIHDRLLDALDSHWADDRILPDSWWTSDVTLPFRTEIIQVIAQDFSGAPLWGLKDPRLCRLLPLWLDIIQGLEVQPSFILSLRHPAEVAASLCKRDGLPHELSCLLWLLHVLQAERLTRNARRVTVCYPDLLGDWRGVMARVGAALGLDFIEGTDANLGSVDSFLDRELRHHPGVNELPDHPVCHLAKTAHDLLAGACPDERRLDELWTKTREITDLIRPWSSHIQRIARTNRSLNHALAGLQGENEALGLEISRVKATVSWQVTKPLRGLANLPRLISRNHGGSHGT